MPKPCTSCSRSRTFPSLPCLLIGPLRRRLGLLMRRGTQLGALAVAVGIALVYYLLSMRLGQQLATSNMLPPLLCAWAVNTTGLVVGLVLCRKAFAQ